MNNAEKRFVYALIGLVSIGFFVSWKFSPNSIKKDAESSINKEDYRAALDTQLKLYEITNTPVAAIGPDFKDKLRIAKAARTNARDKLNPPGQIKLDANKDANLEEIIQEQLADH